MFLHDYHLACEISMVRTLALKVLEFIFSGKGCYRGNVTSNLISKMDEFVIKVCRVYSMILVSHLNEQENKN